MSMPKRVSHEPDGRPRFSRQQRELITGLLFISPWIIGFLFFQLIPILQSLYYSFTDFSLIRAPRWIGLQNYILLFTQDKNFWLSMTNTIYMVVIGVPVTLVISFLCALLLNQKLRGQSFFRTIFVLPSVMPAVAASLLFLWVFNPQVGLVNTLLGALGISGPTWFYDPLWSKPTLIIMLVWLAGPTTIIYLAGLQRIPAELYEAAEMEGARSWQKTRFITIPLMAPITLFNMIVGLIYAFQMFAEPFMISTGVGGAAAELGRPQGSMLLYSIYLYQNAFVYIRMGKASAMAWVLFVIILIVTVLMLRASRSRAEYDLR